MEIYELKNIVQHYPWGSSLWLPELLGEENPQGLPWAELWMGTHPGGPSMLASPPGESLAGLIAGDKARYLGTSGAKAWGGLPFLFKVLAAEKPLSIQAHPNKEQARAGWERENLSGLAPDAADATGIHERNYKDPNHKPEIICALSSFKALCGFRDITEFRKLLGAFLSRAADALKTALEPLVPAPAPGENPYRAFFSALFALPPQTRDALSIYARGAAKELSGAYPAQREIWLTAASLAEIYPGDPGILSPLYLNLLELAPGEAMFIPAGVLHAYIHGLGIELMAASDNVLRGGLTGKRIDLPELCRILEFAPFKPEILKAPPPGTGFYSYPSPAEEFTLSVMAGGGAGRPWPFTGPAIAIVTRGEAVFSSPLGGAGIAEMSNRVNNDGKIVFHKSLYRTKKNPYPNLPRVQGISSGGGVSPIGTTAKAVSGGSLSARDDILNIPQSSDLSSPRSENFAQDILCRGRSAFIPPQDVPGELRVSGDVTLYIASLKG